MGISDVLKEAGYKAEKSTEGDRPILKGIYKALFVEGKVGEPNQYGHSYIAKFKVVETLSGKDSRSAFPEFAGFYDIAEKAADKKKGIAKLLNGFFSVGLNIDSSSDEKLYESLDSLKGSAEVYIKGFEKKPRMLVGEEWVDNPEGVIKQDFNFMTKVNAEKDAAKAQKANGNPL